MRIDDIETPALVVDLEIMERNLRRAADYAAAHSLRLKPHTKTHKCVAIARRQLELGAAGLTVAKVSEAEVMLGSEPAEMLVAFPVLGDAKLRRLMRVAEETRVTVALDSAFVAAGLSAAAKEAGVTIGVLVEFDAGLRRVGVAPGEALVELARAIEPLPNLRLEGIAFYAGQIKTWDEAGRREFAHVTGILAAVLDEFRAAGIGTPIVSAGSTPTLFHSHEMPGLNEIRPGTYLFGDVNTVLSGALAWEDCAATIHATVVSTSILDQIVIDGGSKTFSSDRLASSPEVTFGRVVDAPEMRFHKMNEEHGFIATSGGGRRFAVGDRVRIFPNHICTAINLLDRIYGVCGDTVERVWAVDARGKVT
jgi:D-serine deaminase-like pyridoxal phosphate-dependent protein